VTGIRAGRPGIDFRHGQGFFLLPTASILAVGINQPLIQWIPRALFLWFTKPWRKADHSPSSSVEIKNTWSYSSTPQYIFMG